MRLNVGCGLNKLEGYINIDINPKVNPDKVMPAYCLDFKDLSFQELKATQLIEHLGFFKAKYFLSEAYRVLKDNGLLIVETPYIEKTFENFLNAENSQEREIILGWVYGSESEGMNHIYCFPQELLDAMFIQAGFITDKKDFYDYEPLRPAVRYSAVKNKSYKADKISSARKKMLDLGVLNFSDEKALALIERDLLLL